MAFNAGDIEAKLTLDRTPFQRELDKAIRQGREFSKMRFTATLDADKRPFTKALNEARAAGVRFDQTKYDTKLGADRSGLKRALKDATSDIRKFTRSGGSASIGLDSEEVETETQKVIKLTHDAGITVANNFRSPWRRFKWPAIFAGITAAAAAVPAALVGAGGAAGALAGAFIGPVKAFESYSKAADAVASGSDTAGDKIANFNEQMKSMTPAARDFVNQTLGMDKAWNKFSAAMQTKTLPGFTAFLSGIKAAFPAITRGVGSVGAAVSQVMAEFGALFKSPIFQGALERAFQNSVPVVRSLGKFVTGLFEDITNFVSKTETLGIGLANMIDEAGRGFRGFFDEIIPFSDTMGQSFAAVGSIIGDLFTALGRFAGIMSTGLAPGLEVLRGTLDGVYDVINNFVAGALPGFTAAWSAAGSIIGAFATAIAPIAGLLGSVAGSLAPFALALKAIDMITFGKVGAQFSTLKANVKGTTGVVGKAKAAFSVLGSAGFGPLGVAALALGGLLTALGNKQREAAEKAALHKERVKELTQALIEDGGALGAATRASVTKSLSDQDAFKHATNFGYSLGQVTSAALGNKGALDVLNGSMNRRRGEIEQLIRKENMHRGGNKETTEALGEQLAALNILQGGLNAEAAATEAATQAALELEAAENGVSVATIKAMNATIANNSALAAGVSANLAYREASHAVKTSTDAVNESIKAGNKGTDEHISLVHSQERAILTALEAKKKDVFETNKAAGETNAAKKSVDAYNREALNLAGTLTGPIPPALRKIISGMSQSDAKAVGAKVSVDEFGNAVVKLPNGKTIKLTAETQAARNAVSALQNMIDNIHGKTVTVGVSTSWSTPGSIRRGQLGRSTGGFWDSSQPYDKKGPRYQGGGEHSGLLRGPGSGISDDIRAPWLSDGEFIVRQKQTKKHLPLLRAINDGKEGFADGGVYNRNRALRGMLAQLGRGGSLFEDFSFRGMSKNVGRFNDAIADKFFGSHRGFDFGPKADRKVITSFLRGELRKGESALARQRQKTTRTPARAAVAAAPTTSEIARAVSSAVTAAMSNMGIEIYIGGERIAEIAEIAVTRSSRNTMRGVRAGAGRNR